MRVLILVTGMYADFASPAKVTTKPVQAGSIVDLPDDYALGLLQASLADVCDEEAPEGVCEAPGGDSAVSVGKESGGTSAAAPGRSRKKAGK